MPSLKRRIYRKHQLSVGRYRQQEGVIRLPKDSYWMVLKHSGAGNFTNQPDADGPIALILTDDTGRGRSRNWPVISFLTEEEARHLAKRLLQYAGPPPEPQPPPGAYDPKKGTGQLL